jgi:hypothetical protein
MSKLDEVKTLIEALDHEEFWQFSAWFDGYRADRWDQQIEEDAEAGRLDKFYQKALADLRAGRTRPL